MTDNRLTKDWITEEWNNLEYQEAKKNNFVALDRYLKMSPSTILDIGCGLAWESRMFNKKYNTRLWLIEGDVTDNNIKDSLAADVKYHDSANGFLYYNTLSRIDNELKKLGTVDYTLLDCNNLKLPDIKFDLITSWLSCGFHYPVSTYVEIMKSHSHDKTRIIVDLRRQFKTGEIISEDCFEIVDIVNTTKKSVTAEIQIK